MTKGNHHDRNQLREALKTRYERQRQLKEDWEHMSLEQAVKTLADMRADMQQGAEIIQSRLSAQKGADRCVVCGKEITGNPTSIETIRDPETALMYNKFYCSAECVARKQQGLTGVLALQKT
jgi:hypothetical protein